MTTTTYLELDDQANGANNNTWGDVADANMGFIELAIARTLAVSTTGGTTTLTTAQNRYPLIRVTGVLISNATIVVRTAEKHFVVKNDTTGAFTVTVKTTAGTGKTVPRGRAIRVYCDGTNVEMARYQAIPHAAGAGAVDVITAVFEPAFVAAEIQDGTLWAVEALGANATTTPTFNPDTTGALTIKKQGAQALVAGDIPRAGFKMLLMYDASGGHVELLNPAVLPTASETVSGIVELATTAEAEAGSDTSRAVTPAGLLAAVVGQETIWIPAGALTARTTNGAAAGTVETTTNKVMLKTFDFDTTTQEFAQFAIQMPKSWNEGTVVAQFVWSHASTVTNFGVVWALEAVSFADDDAADTAFGTAQQIADTGGTTNDIYITGETPAITIAGSPAAEEWVVFQVKRVVADGSDTLAVDARLHGVKVHITTDAFTDD